MERWLQPAISTIGSGQRMMHDAGHEDRITRDDRQRAVVQPRQQQIGVLRPIVLADAAGQRQPMRNVGRRGHTASQREEEMTNEVTVC